MIRNLSFGFAMLLASTGAYAAPINGTFNISVYQADTNSGDINAASQQALITNTLITGTPNVSLTYTGNLNFISSDVNSLQSFIESGGGEVTNLFGMANYNAPLSTSNFDITSVFVITGTTDAHNILAGTVTHDDGATLYNAAGATLFSSYLPTTATSSAYAGLTGAFTLVYVEANDLPAVLNFDVSSVAVPEPFSLALLGTGLVGLGMIRRKRA